MEPLNRQLAAPYMIALGNTARLLEQVRALLGEPLIVDRGFRCPELNTLIGGSTLSQHMIGEAVDFKGADWTDDKFMDALKSISNSGIRFHQLLIEHGCLHIALPHPNDLHGEVAYWNAGVKQVIQARVSA